MILPPRLSIILLLIGMCLQMAGTFFPFPQLTRYSSYFLGAGMVVFFGYLLWLFIEEPSGSAPDVSLTTYLRAFSSDWLTGMSGPLSVPFAALAVWSPKLNQKVIWGALALASLLYASYRVWRQERLSNFNKRARAAID